MASRISCLVGLFDFFDHCFFCGVSSSSASATTIEGGTFGGFLAPGCGVDDPGVLGDACSPAGTGSLDPERVCPNESQSSSTSSIVTQSSSLRCIGDEMPRLGSSSREVVWLAEEMLLEMPPAILADDFSPADDGEQSADDGADETGVAVRLRNGSRERPSSTGSEMPDISTSSAFRTPLDNKDRLPEIAEARKTPADASREAVCKALGPSGEAPSAAPVV